MNPSHHFPEKLGIIAGGGHIPGRLVSACLDLGITPFIIAFEGQTDPQLTEGHSHFWARLGGAGHIIRTLKKHAVQDLVLVGSIRRPCVKDIFPDAKALSFFAKAGLKALSGDDSLLRALRHFLEEEGFALHGVHKIARDLLTPEAVLTKVKPSEDQQADIERGVCVTQLLGRADVGQAAVVQAGVVLAIEAVEGTDQLIERARCLQRKGTGGVLVKTCKPQQDEDLDLPTIGLDTLKNAHLAGLSGVAVHAEHSLMMNRDELIEFADAHKMFVVGVNVDGFTAEEDGVD